MSTPNPMALVTGASSGIGSEFARALAARGDDLVVVARDASRLDALAERLEAQYGVNVEVLSADLTSKKGRAVVEARLESAEPAVDLLVNNAGMGTYGKFAELSREGETRVIRLNVLAVVQLSHAALPGMIERGRGGIINVSSLAGHQPTPLNATYGGTKAFVTSFSQALHEELRGTGVKVMVLCPGFTRTEFQERAGLDSGSVPSFLWQTPEPVVGAALRAYDQGRAVCIPGALNQAGAAVSSALPAGITRRIAGAVVPRVE
ncbi:MAG TPA: SDR family oxidoreductase [Acidimicrobiia bacterium]|nr:SDR family oxidoreductase [Acidimicrobiia bacterium]